MTDADGLLARVAQHAETGEEAVPPPVTATELAAAEALLGVTLPPLLAGLYREVGNGGFGPGYRLFPLTGPGESLVETYLAERAGIEGEDDPHWPAGVLPILTWGCGMFAAVDCLSGAGAVLHFEPNGVEGGWEEAWYVDAPSLAQWLETWLAGTGWYEDGAPGDGEPTDPRPWEEAAARLSASA